MRCSSAIILYPMMMNKKDILCIYCYAQKDKTFLRETLTRFITISVFKKLIKDNVICINKPCFISNITLSITHKQLYTRGSIKSQ